MPDTPGNRRVLVVEDHPDSRRLLSRLLRMQGYVVFEAATCADALTLQERERCRLIVSDISLPDCSGLELMREVRQRQSAVRGLAVSGHTDPSDAKSAREAGFDRLVPKPFKFDDLLKHVRDLMN